MTRSPSSSARYHAALALAVVQQRGDLVRGQDGVDESVPAARSAGRGRVPRRRQVRFSATKPKAPIQATSQHQDLHGITLPRPPALGHGSRPCSMRKVRRRARSAARATARRAPARRSRAPRERARGRSARCPRLDRPGRRGFGRAGWRAEPARRTSRARGASRTSRAGSGLAQQHAVERAIRGHCAHDAPDHRSIASSASRPRPPRAVLHFRRETRRRCSAAPPRSPRDSGRSRRACRSQRRRQPRRIGGQRLVAAALENPSATAEERLEGRARASLAREPPQLRAAADPRYPSVCSDKLGSRRPRRACETGSGASASPTPGRSGWP